MQTLLYLTPINILYTFVIFFKSGAKCCYKMEIFNSIFFQHKIMSARTLPEKDERFYIKN